jgi:tRNA(Ile2) C34 agmatinyltransferase TiaS
VSWFKCEACGKRFKSERPDGEADRAYRETYTEEEQAEGRALICEECYQQGVAAGLIPEERA